jgi:hypothetical protein
MKHLVIIAVGLAAVLLALNYARIRHLAHRGPEQQALTGAASPRLVRSSPAASVGSNAPAALVPAMVGTNAAESNAVFAAAPGTPSTNWSAEMAARYADLIKGIRAAREN